MANSLKTFVLLAGLTALLLAIGQGFGGRSGLIFALFFAGIMNFVSYFWSDKIVLKMYNAQEITQESAPQLHKRVWPLMQQLTTRAGLPMPRLFLIPTDTPNAFATGRNPKHAVVAMTAGIVQLLSDAELEGVLAHELGHVKNRDILIGSVAAMIAGAISHLATMGQWAMIFGGMGRSDDDDRPGAEGLLMIILAPIAAMLIQMAISRSREYKADATAAELTGNPYGLVNALEKLEGMNRRLPMHANPATAHMFIVKPFSGRAMLELFSTHPPMEKRIAALLGR